jgi:hypothetical protein
MLRPVRRLRQPTIINGLSSRQGRRSPYRFIGCRQMRHASHLPTFLYIEVQTLVGSKRRTSRVYEHFPTAQPLLLKQLGAIRLILLEHSVPTTKGKPCKTQRNFSYGCTTVFRAKAGLVRIPAPIANWSGTRRPLSLAGPTAIASLIASARS